MKRNYYIVCLALFGLAACQPDKHSDSGLVTIDVRQAMQQSVNSLSLDDEIEQITYIPLETKDSCLISNILDMKISEDFIFIYNGKTSEILQFDKQGHFLRKIGREGNGPGEYNLITELAVDEAKRLLYVFQYSGPALTYSFDGIYQQADTTLKYTGGMYVLPDGKRALKGLTMNPIQNAPWAGALADQSGQVIQAKPLFPAIDNQEVLYMKEICFAPSDNQVLLFTACKDTIYRIASSGIEPKYVINRSNEADYYEAVGDISKMNAPVLASGNIIGVYDLFETKRSLYIRVYKGEQVFIQRYNKLLGTCESYVVPEEFIEYSEAIPGNNMVGIAHKQAGGIPFWPEFAAGDGVRAQIVTAYALSGLKENGYLESLPEGLDIKENDNPLILLYKFKP